MSHNVRRFRGLWRFDFGVLCLGLDLNSVIVYGPVLAHGEGRKALA